VVQLYRVGWSAGSLALGGAAVRYDACAVAPGGRN